MCECNVKVSSLVHNIETHSCLDPSHTRASMIDIINIIRKHTQMHIRYGNYFLLPPQRWAGAHATRNFALLAKIVVMQILSHGGPRWNLSWKEHTTMVIHQFAKSSICDKLDVGWIEHHSPKCTLVGSTITLITLWINVWAMQVINLPFPCLNSCINKMLKTHSISPFME